MELDDTAEAVPGLLVDRNNGLGADLVVRAAPDDPRLHRSDRLARDAVDRRRKSDLDEWNHLAERWTQTDVLHAALQIGKAVFEGKAVIDIVRIGRAGAFGLSRKIHTEVAGDRERAQI